MNTTSAMWRPRAGNTDPYDFIKSSERARLERKWDLFQAKRKGIADYLIAQCQRNFDYYEVSLPQWRARRAETDAQLARMLAAADGCVIYWP